MDMIMTAIRRCAVLLTCLEMGKREATHATGSVILAFGCSGEVIIQKVPIK